MTKQYRYIQCRAQYIFMYIVSQKCVRHLRWYALRVFICSNILLTYTHTLLQFENVLEPENDNDRCYRTRRRWSFFGTPPFSYF